MIYQQGNNNNNNNGVQQHHNAPDARKTRTMTGCVSLPELPIAESSPRGGGGSSSNDDDWSYISHIGSEEEVNVMGGSDEDYGVGSDDNEPLLAKVPGQVASKTQAGYVARTNSSARSTDGVVFPPRYVCELQIKLARWLNPF